MKKLIDRLEQFLGTHTVWMHLIGILGISVTLVFQENNHSWLAYLGYVVMGVVTFLPPLLFATFRKFLFRNLHIVLFVLLWAILFILYPNRLEWLNWHEKMTNPAYGKIMIRACGFWFLATELILLANHYWSERIKEQQWIKQLSVEKVVLIFTAIFAVFYSMMGFYISGHALGITTLVEKVSITAQILIICLIYYCFYYINHYFLIARIWMKKGVVIYGFAFLATVIILSPIAAQLITLLPMVQKTSIHPLHNGRIFEDINFWIPFLGMLASIPFILAVEWFKQRSEIDNLEKEKSATELNLLKQQINPHFFFNTLNNLYALSIKKDEATPEVILQLSELMRYVIYKGKEESVKLEEEVKYIEDYVQLQQIRLHKKLDYQFDKTIDDPTLEVPPLLFILLVENAFKHGVEPAEEDCYLKISLKSNEKSLVFTCENSVEENGEEEAGIGLQNLKRRLELRFPNRHDLSITERTNSFLVELKLDLA